MSQISLEELTNIKTRIESNSDPLQEIVNEIVKKYCSTLDDYMEKVDLAVSQPNELPTSKVEDLLLNINSILYWTGGGLEKTTIQESMAKMIKDERYNNSYNDADGTIGDKKAIAQLDSQKEEIVRICYTNAVKLYQHKIDMASEMAGSLKKVLTHRIGELNMNKMDIR